MPGHYQIEAGSLLVSQQITGDDHFDRSVILIVEHNTEGDVGFILNKCWPFDLDEVFDDVSTVAEYSLCMGGPVSVSTLHYLHTLGSGVIPGAIDLGSGVYWGGDFEKVSSMVRKGEIESDEIKFFIGYSGWSKGQLEDEIARGDWGVYNSYDIEDIVGCNDSLWYKFLQRSPRFVAWSVMPQNMYEN